MQGDTEEDVNSNTSSIEKGTQPLTTAGLTTVTSMPQSSSRSSTNRPLRVDERYKETPNSPRKSLSSNASKAFKETSSPMHFTLPSHLLKTCTLPPPEDPLQSTSPTSTTMKPLSERRLPLPLPLLFPFPLLTHVRWPLPGSPPLFTCHAPSPVNYWMPEDEDIQGDMGTAAKHTAFVAAHRFTFGLSWSGAIRMNRGTDPRASLPLPVRILVTQLSQTRMIDLPTELQVIIRTQPEPAQPAPLPALTQQQLQ
jgi:hypothetical protein